MTCGRRRLASIATLCIGALVSTVAGVTPVLAGGRTNAAGLTEDELAQRIEQGLIERRILADP